MTNNVETTKMGNFDMASAADRILRFREDTGSKGKIATKFVKDEEGYLVFKSYVWREKAEFMELLKSGVSEEIALLSADSQASARGETKGKKDFEKLETIATGRALAYLGYMANGRVASTEEMDNFNQYKEDAVKTAIESAVEYLEESTNMDDLKERFSSLSAEVKGQKEVFDAKEAMKEKLTKAANVSKAKESEKKASKQ